MMLDPVERLLRVSKALVDRGKSTKAEELRAVLLATKKKIEKAWGGTGLRSETSSDETSSTGLVCTFTG